MADDDRIIRASDCVIMLGDVQIKGFAADGEIAWSRRPAPPRQRRLDFGPYQLTLSSTPRTPIQRAQAAAFLYAVDCWTLGSKIATRLLHDRQVISARRLKERATKATGERMQSWLDGIKWRRRIAGTLALAERLGRAARG